MNRIRTRTGTRTLLAVAGTAAALAAPALGLAVASPASAQGADRGVSTSGSCTGGGTWSLSVKPDDGQLEVEFEVDTNVAGQTFAVRLADGRTVIFSGQRTTAGASGSFSVEQLTPDRAGTDTIKAVAKRAGNTCAGSVSI